MTDITVDLSCFGRQNASHHQNISDSATVMTVLWLAGSILALCMAFVFLELAVRVPRSGGIVVYLSRAFGPGTAFVYGWTFIFAIGTALAFIARTFADYAGALSPMSESSLRVIAVSLIAFHSLAALRSTRFAAGLVNVAGAAKIMALLLLLVVSFGFSSAVVPGGARITTASTLSLTGLALGLVSIIVAFDGNIYATLLTGEVKKPSRDMPLGILCGTVIVGALYTLVSAGYVHVLSFSGVQSSSAVAADAMGAVLGQRGLRLMAALVMGSTFITVGAAILGSSRNVYAMAQDGVFFRHFAHVHPRWKTPWLSVAILGTTAMVMVFLGNYPFLTRIYFFVEYPMIAIAALASVRLRRNEGLPEEYQMPFYPWPVVAVAGLLTLIVFFGAMDDPMFVLYGFVVMALGTVAYRGWRRSAARNTVATLPLKYR